MSTETVAEMAEAMCMEVAKSGRFWRDLGPDPWAAAMLGADLMFAVLFLSWVYVRWRADMRRIDFECSTARCPSCHGKGRVPFGAAHGE